MEIRKETFRTTQLSLAQQVEFDIIVVGGTFLGANIALEASLSGAKVCLLAHKDFGSFDQPVELVSNPHVSQGKQSPVKSFYERASHLFTATELVRPRLKKAVYNGSKVKSTLVNIWKKASKQTIDCSQLAQIIPVKDANYYTGALVQDVYKLDLFRLITETVKAAKLAGAIVLNHIQPTAFNASGSVQHVSAIDALTQNTVEFRAKYIIYLAETPVPRLSELGNLTIRSRSIYQGFVPKSKLQITKPLRFDLPGFLPAYAIPQYDSVTISFLYNEYSDYDCSIMQPSIIKAFQTYFPDIKLGYSDIYKTNYSYRPAIDYVDRNQFKAQNNLLLATASDSLSALEVTTDILAHLKDKLGITIHQEQIRLACQGVDFSNHHKVDDFVDEKYNEAKSTGITMRYFSHLARRYGSNIDWITNKAYDNHKPGTNWQQNWIACEVDYAVQFEDVQTLEDFFFQRTAECYLRPADARLKMELVADRLAELFHWSLADKESQLAKFDSKQGELAI